MSPRKKPIRRKKAAPASVGLSAAEIRDANIAELETLGASVQADGGEGLGRYRDPYGGTPLLLAALPVDRVEPTPYQRDASDTHGKRLIGVIQTIGPVLDPIAPGREDGQYPT